MRLGFGARMLVSAATVGVCGVVLSFGHASAGHVAAGHAMQRHVMRVTGVRHVSRTSARRLQQPPVVAPCTTCKPAKAGKTRLRLHRPYGLHRLLRRPWWLRGRRWRRRWHPLWWLGF